MPEKQKELRQYFETQFWHIVFPIVFISPIQILRSVLELKRCSFCIVSLCVCAFVLYGLRDARPTLPPRYSFRLVRF